LHKARGDAVLCKTALTIAFSEPAASVAKAARFDKEDHRAAQGSKLNGNLKNSIKCDALKKNEPLLM